MKERVSKEKKERERENIVRLYVLVNGAGFASSLKAEVKKTEKKKENWENPRVLPIRLHRASGTLLSDLNVFYYRFEVQKLDSNTGATLAS